MKNKKEIPENKLKEAATSFIEWFAKDNNDVNEFKKMYGLVWAMLMFIGFWSSYNAAQADFSVLYGNHFNIHHNASSAWWYGASIAFFIQCLILIPAGVIFKILVNGLVNDSDANKKRKHGIQLAYLSPILLIGLTWSGKLSINMDKAVRAESHNEYMAILQGYENQLAKKDSIDQQNELSEESQLKQERNLINEKFEADSLATLVDYNGQIDSLKRRAARLKDLHKSERGKPWMLGQAKKISKNYIPNLRQKRQLAIQQLKQSATTTLSEQKTAISNIYQYEKAQQDSSHNFIAGKIKKQIALMEGDMKFQANKKMLLSILFNFISLIIISGLHEVYKQINKEHKQNNPPPNTLDNHSKMIPVSYRGQAPVSPVTQEAQAAQFPPTQKVVQADIDKLKRYISSTYYPRCFLKSQIGEKGSSSTGTCYKNQDKVRQMLTQLADYGVAANVNFESFEKVTFVE